MTGADLKTFVESLIDDSVEDTLFYQLLNVARVKLEEETDWEYLKGWDTSIQLDSSITISSRKTLPTNFKRAVAAYKGDNDDVGFFFIDYGEIYRYKNAGGYAFIDYANNQIGFTGSFDNAYSLNLYYLKEQNDIAADTSPSFKAKFHPLLGYMVAGYITAGVDADDIYARMSPEHKIAAVELKSSMLLWDSKMKLAAQNEMSSPINVDGSYDLE